MKSPGRHGVRREYTPPPEVAALIAARQRGELPELQPKAPRVHVVDETVSVYQTHAAPAPAWINVEALAQAILAMQQLRPNEPLAEQVKKGVEFYQYCVERGLVTRDGNGSGDLKGAA